MDSREELIKDNVDTRKALSIICSPRYRGICKKDLMRMLEIRRPAFDKLIINLEEEGLIILEIDSFDKRKIKILPKGDTPTLIQRINARLKKDFEKFKKQLEELGVDTSEW